MKTERASTLTLLLCGFELVTKIPRPGPARFPFCSASLVPATFGLPRWSAWFICPNSPSCQQTLPSMTKNKSKTRRSSDTESVTSSASNSSRTAAGSGQPPSSPRVNGSHSKRKQSASLLNRVSPTLPFCFP